MSWDVPDFLRTYLVSLRSSEDIVNEPRITESFITYIYGEACCTELRDARHAMNEWWDEKGYQRDLTNYEKDKYPADVLTA